MERCTRVSYRQGDNTPQNAIVVKCFWNCPQISNCSHDREEFFLAKTDPEAIYGHVVAETDYLDDLREGWDYALRNFITQYKLIVQQRPQESYLKNESMSNKIKRQHRSKDALHNPTSTLFKMSLLQTRVS